VVIDCVGSPASLADALAVTRPGGRIVLAGMPGHVRVDLTPLWQRELTLSGAYAYGVERRPEGTVATFALARDLAAAASLGRLVSARYPLSRHGDAVRHAAEAGRRGGVKVVFDLRRPSGHPGSHGRPGRWDAERTSEVAGGASSGAVQAARGVVLGAGGRPPAAGPAGGEVGR
jgi:hypothetical protein